MNNIVRTLRRLGFSTSTYSEVILSIKHGNIVNYAPMGVLLVKDALHLRVYMGSLTYKLIMEGAKDCVLNITSDPILFYNSILDKSRVKTVGSIKVKSPRISGCQGYIECLISDVVKTPRYLRVLLNPIHIDYYKIIPTTYKRASSAIIEALVYYTKLPYLKGSSGDLLSKIKLCVNTVFRSTKNPKYRGLARDILLRAYRITQDLSTR